MTFLLLNILVGAAVSFAGSLPVGVINVTALHIGWSRGFRAVFYFALACAAAEAFYSTLAVAATAFFVYTDWQKTGAHLVSVVVLLAGGIHYWRKRSNAVAISRGVCLFAKGILLSLVNVAAIPFWLMYTSVLRAYGWISVDDAPAIASFVAGIASGTCLALLLFGIAGRQAGQRFDLNARLINQGVGLALFGLGLLQIVWLIC
jgi:threonine/homoserine/homoserine lactone efflux protein